MNTNQKKNRSGLPNKLISYLTAVSNLKEIQKNSYLFHEGAHASELYLIEAGFFYISKVNPDGKEFNMRVAKSGDIIGELTLFSEDSRYMLSAWAAEDSRVLVIEKNNLEKKLSMDPGLAIEFMKWMSNMMRINQIKIRDLISYGKKGALYSTIIRLSNSYGIQRENGIELDIHLTHYELAKFCITSRENVNRMLRDLKNMDVLDVMSNGHIIVYRIEYLREQINCENCPVSICRID